MIHLIKLIYNPGGENESSNMAPRNEDLKENSIEKTENIESNDTNKDHKTFMEKVKEALHDWSNKDEQDQKFDDTRV